MDIFDNLSRLETVFLICVAVGLLFFIIRVVVYFMGRDYNEAIALKTIFTLRLVAFIIFFGVTGFVCQRLGFSSLETMIYGVLGGCVVAELLTLFSRPLSLVLTATLRRLGEPQAKIFDDGKGRSK